MSGYFRRIECRLYLFLGGCNIQHHHAYVRVDHRIKAQATKALSKEYQVTKRSPAMSACVHPDPFSALKPQTPSGASGNAGRA
jgi:hypothetical protein